MRACWCLRRAVTRSIPAQPCGTNTDHSSAGMVNVVFCMSSGRPRSTSQQPLDRCEALVATSNLVKLDLAQMRPGFTPTEPTSDVSSVDGSFKNETGRGGFFTFWSLRSACSSSHCFQFLKIGYVCLLNGLRRPLCEDDNSWFQLKVEGPQGKRHVPPPSICGVGIFRFIINLAT